MSLYSCSKCKTPIVHTIHKTGICTKCRTKKCSTCDREIIIRKECDVDCFDCRVKKKSEDLRSV